MICFKDKEGMTSYQLKTCQEMDPNASDYFEMSANVEIELYQQLTKDEPISMRYQIGIFTTVNKELSDQCRIDYNTEDYARSLPNPARWNVVVEKSHKERTLTCNQIDNLKYECLNVPIAKGEIESYFKYNGFLIDADMNQPNFKLLNIDIDLNQRNVEHTFHLTCLKYLFAAISVITIYFYWKSINTFQQEDLGLIQKWIMFLLIQLFLFNEPFTGLKWVFPYKSYYVIQAITQSTFIAMILFFWLVIVHSISSNEVINIDERRFYLPKVLLCIGIWMVLTLSMSYVNIKQVEDPSFNWRDDLGRFYSTMQLLSVILFLLYSSYFVIVAYVAFFQVNEMKKSYKFSLFLTFIVIFLSISLILCEGYSVSSNDTTVYVAYVALFNIYMYVISYLYSPSVNGLEDLQFKQARREHEHIMNQFYEQELPDISKDMNTSKDQIKPKQKPNHAEKRRHQKKDPQQKAKEKLWESIIKETEEENDDSSDDEHQI